MCPALLSLILSLFLLLFSLHVLFVITLLITALNLSEESNCVCSAERQRKSKVMLFTSLLGAGLALSVQLVQATTTPKETKNGAVASEDSRCTKIGIDVLKQNGTAADAVSSHVSLARAIENRNKPQLADVDTKSDHRSLQHNSV